MASSDPTDSLSGDDLGSSVVGRAAATQQESSLMLHLGSNAKGRYLVFKKLPSIMRLDKPAASHAKHVSHETRSVHPREPTEVCDFDAVVRVEQQVFGLEVSMHNHVHVTVLNARHNLLK